MWTVMGCSDCGEFNKSDSINGRKLRPLMPRPPTSTPSYSSVANPSFCSCLHEAHLLTLNDHLGTFQEQSNPDIRTVPLVTPRWNPTSEQLRALEEMYEGGTRTPTAEQIKQIAAKLRLFGKIEGKNVFYWFQNHKARERQKRRRELLDLSSGHQEEQLGDPATIERKKQGFEVAPAKNKVTSNCSTLSEESESIRRAVGLSGSRTDGWDQFEEKELYQRRSSCTQTEHPKCWQQLLKPSCSSPSPTHFMKSLTAITAPEEASGSPIDPNLSGGITAQNYQNQCIKWASNTGFVDEEEIRQSHSQTLQLFPPSSGVGNNGERRSHEVPTTMVETRFTPVQFFEFLPLKN
ncbi:hypothetical protein U1Q18_029665 [Sarracenia purpurea var. burkii]